MQSNLRKPFAAAVLMSSAVLLAQPALAREQHVVVQAPAVIPAVVVAQRDGDHDNWRRGWRRDERAPVISALTPVPGDRTGDRRRTEVSARFSDHFSGIDEASVRLRIDGRDVTPYARIDGDEVRIRENLAPGRHLAEVMVRDRAGNLARRSWQFDVVDRDRGHDRYGYGYGAGGWQR
jgi:hypothetical protein